MANKRAYSLTEVTGDKTGYSIPLDKSGDAECGMVMYEDIIAEAVALAIPVITTPTITETVDADVVTVTVSKKAVHGLTHALNLNFSVSITDDKTSGTFELDSTSIGTVGQTLSCIVDGAACKCIVTDDSPFQINVDWAGIKSGATVVQINGTLITTS
jgi:hypothetical protein